MPIVNLPSLEQASIYTDLSSLDNIRRQGQVDELGAIKKAAKEFEAFFMNMMLKSMRQASDVIGEDSPLASQQEQMYVGMMDEQLSVNLSQGGHLKIADLMVAQLANENVRVKNSLDLTHHLKNIKNPPAEKQPIESADIDPLRKISMPSKTQLPEVSLRAEQPAQPTHFQAQEKSETISAHKINAVQTGEKAVLEVNPVVQIKPTKKALFDQIQDFISELMPFAQKAAEKLSMDPRLLIAQAALETGWGQFIMHDDKGSPGFNLFGIKAGDNWQGESITIDTLEVEDQQVKKVNANFRKYNSFSESFDDYINFVTSSPRYQNAVNSAPKAKEYIEELQSSGYATDPQYAEKVLRIFEDQKLQNFAKGSE
jgi:peptidoglycan hydrolase FlgJ